MTTAVPYFALVEGRVVDFEALDDEGALAAYAGSAVWRVDRHRSYVRVVPVSAPARGRPLPLAASERGYLLHPPEHVVIAEQQVDEQLEREKLEREIAAAKNAEREIVRERLLARAGDLRAKAAGLREVLNRWASAIASGVEGEPPNVEDLAVRAVAAETCARILEEKAGR